MESKDFKSLVYSTSTGTVYAYVNGTKREIQKVRDKYCFISSKSILENCLNIAPIFKKPKYANFFNEESQKLIHEYINS